MKVKFIIGILLAIIIGFISCNKTDDVPPIIFMNGADTLVQILNQPYVDEGATATDETDGNITYNIYVDNPVDENKVGWYTITYTVIDEAGNEAAPATRDVFVLNEAYTYSYPTNIYQLTETQQFPDQTNCQYNITTGIDSTINYRIVFNDFACGFGQPVVADVSGEYILIPFQIIEDSLSSFVIQGSGSITDTLMLLDYTLKSDSITTLWDAELKRY